MKSLLRNFLFILSFSLSFSNLTDAAIAGGSPAGHEADDEGGSAAAAPRRTRRVRTGISVCQWMQDFVYARMGWEVPEEGPGFEDEESALSSGLSRWSRIRQIDQDGCWGRTRNCLKRANRRWLPFPINRSDLIAAGVAGTAGAAFLSLQLYNMGSVDPYEATAHRGRFLQTDDASIDTSDVLGGSVGVIGTALAGALVRRAWVMFNSSEGREDCWRAFVNTICSCCRKREDRMFYHGQSTEEGNELRTRLAASLAYLAQEYADRTTQNTYLRTVIQKDGSTRIFVFYEPGEDDKPKVKFTIRIRKAHEHDYATNWSVSRRDWGKINWLSQRDLRSPTGLEQMVRELIGEVDNTSYLTDYFARLLHPSRRLLGHKFIKSHGAYQIGNTTFPPGTHEMRFLETVWVLGEHGGREQVTRVPLFFVDMVNPKKKEDDRASFEPLADDDGEGEAHLAEGAAPLLSPPPRSAAARQTHRRARRASVHLHPRGITTASGVRETTLRRTSSGNQLFSPRLGDEGVPRADTDNPVYLAAAQDRGFVTFRDAYRGALSEGGDSVGSGNVGRPAEGAGALASRAAFSRRLEGEGDAPPAIYTDDAMSLAASNPEEEEGDEGRRREIQALESSLPDELHRGRGVRAEERTQDASPSAIGVTERDSSHSGEE